MKLTKKKLIELIDIQKGYRPEEITLNVTKTLSFGSKKVINELSLYITWGVQHYTRILRSIYYPNSIYISD
jgi:hypothetical protein